MTTKMKTMTITRMLRGGFTILLALAITDVSALAQRGRGNVRSSSRSTVNTRNVDRNVNRNTNVNRNVNVDRNVNRNIDVDRDVDFDRDIDFDVDYDGCCYRGGWGTAAAVATTAAVTAAVVGSVAYTLPSSCTVVVVDGFSYQQCGDVWYQPQLTGNSTTYVVVNPPQ